jgi:glutamine amidotransferase
MCRHIAWLGRPRTLASLLIEPEYGLLRQSYQPRRQRYGLMNADGWGVGWWSADETGHASPAASTAPAAPARWRSARPMWSDTSLLSVAPHVSAHAILGAVRSATAGMPADETAAAPFTRGRWLLSHNGRVDRSVLPDQAWQQAESVCDSAVLAAWLLAAPESLAERVTEVGKRDRTARLNVLAADGDRILATTWGDRLSVLVTPRGVAVASEPYDEDEGWRDIPDRSLLTVTSDGVSITDLGAK